jgi:hypothetical protein
MTNEAQLALIAAVVTIFVPLVTAICAALVAYDNRQMLKSKAIIPIPLPDPVKVAIIPTDVLPPKI